MLVVAAAVRFSLGLLPEMAVLAAVALDQ